MIEGPTEPDPNHTLQNSGVRLSEPVDMSLPQTKGQMEAQIATAITQFEREHLGRGPQEVRTWIMQDLVLSASKEFPPPPKRNWLEI